MKNLFLCLALFLITITASAQSGIARLKYEEAEEAYAKNDFQTTLTKLDEAEKLLKSTNAKILYLRIMAANGIVTTDALANFDLLVDLRKNVNTYLTKYEATVDDRFREIYKIGEDLNKYPKTRAEADKKREERHAYDVAENAKAARLKQNQDFIAKIAARYQYKRGLSKDQFASYNATAAKLLRTKEHWAADYSSSYFSAIKGLGNPYPEGALTISVNKGIVINYQLAIVSGKDEASAKKMLDELTAEVEKNIDPEYRQVDKYGSLNVVVPGAVANYSISKLSYNNWIGTSVGFH